MSGQLTVALDAMGGDLGPDAVIPGAALALRSRGTLKFLIYGDEAKISPLLADYPELAKASTICHTDKFISPEEKPVQALRGGRESSMRLAINAVAEKRASCVVSGGNTGALMAMAKMVLKCLPGVERPAIASVFPSLRGEIVMLDLGANLECDTEMLVQFAVLGSAFSKLVRGHESPTVGLLNVGSEDMKGREELRMAASILQKISFQGRYYGFVEGNDIPQGTVDVVVTDGFTGNIALKTAEGVSKLVSDMLKRSLKSSLLGRIGALLAYGSLKELKASVDPRLYNGGVFLGLDGICVKSHGGMDAVGFSNAIIVAADMAAQDFNAQVAREISSVLGQEADLAVFSEESPKEVQAC